MNAQVYLKENVQIEPLYNQWYAWSYLISPATAPLRCQLALKDHGVVPDCAAGPCVRVEEPRHDGWTIHQLQPISNWRNQGVDGADNERAVAHARIRRSGADVEQDVARRGAGFFTRAAVQQGAGSAARG